MRCTCAARSVLIGNQEIVITGNFPTNRTKIKVKSDL
jgi:hypothetical protein